MQDVAQRHYLRICAENLRFPLMAKFLGGPSPQEAEAALRSAGWSTRRIDNLKKPADVPAEGK